MEKLYQKRIAWIGFVVLFFLILPVLFSQALGYKYNSDKHKFEATGILFVKTYPRDAQLILNDKAMDDKTPWQQPKLLPGVYNLKITKPNYLDWEKNITIYEHTTTFVEDIVLFKRSLPSPVKKFELLDSLTQDNRIHILLGKNNNMISIVKYNVNSDQWDIIKEWDKNVNVNLISVSPNNSKLIYTENNVYKLLLVDNPSIDENITGLSKIYWQDIAWDSTSDNILYSTINNNLYQINISTMPATITNIVYNIVDSFAHNNNVYWFTNSKDNKQLVLNKADKDFNNKEQLLLLPLTTDIEYISSDGLVSLLDNVNDFLYLIDLNKDEIVAKVFPNVVNAAWYRVNYDKILYWNNNELSVYYRDKQESQLITRVSQPIVNAWWHPNGTYAFYQTDTKVNIVEFDPRDKKNNYEIVSLDNNDLFIVNTKGDAIIYYSADDKTIYKQEIQ
ncbi:MAG: PEGA domain-containing protein [Candidatus Komeilibacteria bacterium]